MRLGLTLPQFGADVGALRDAVRAAEAAGVDGVFVFDHLWPIGQPDGTVLHSVPLLGFVAQLTDRMHVGSLVSRVGIVPDAVLANQFATLHRMLGDRLIAGIGTGDELSAAENRAYGLAYPPAVERIATAAAIADRLRDRGVTTWIGGRSPAVRSVAARHADALNVWSASPEQVRAEAGDLERKAHGRAVDVTWGGQVLVGRDDADAASLLARHGSRPRLVHGTIASVGRHLSELAATGCTWTVCAPLDVGAPDAAERLSAAFRAAVTVANGTDDRRAHH